MTFGENSGLNPNQDLQFRNAALKQGGTQVRAESRGIAVLAGLAGVGFPLISSLETSLERLPKVPASADEISRGSRTSWGEAPLASQSVT